jgi:PKD repeat protein
MIIAMTFFSKTLLLLLTLGCCKNSVAQVNLKNGLVAYYPFNGNTNDESGNRHHPTEANITFAADRFGNKNAAGAFNGRNNFVQIRDHADFHFRKGFSISAWVLVKGFYEGKCHGNRILMKGSAEYLKGNYALTFDDNKSSNGSNCDIERPDKLRQSFYAASASPVTNDYVVPGKWYLLTYTYDGTNAVLYVNCKLQAKGVARNNDFSNRYDLFLGKMDNSQYPYWFNGLMDEVRLYNRPLTKDEISFLCNDVPEKTIVPCNEKDIVSAKFGFTIKNCYTVTFDLSSADRKNLKEVKWFLGDGTIASNTALTHTYRKQGTYNVKVVTMSKSGCADTSTRVVTISTLKADFTFSATGEPGNIQFTPKDKYSAYEWNFGTDKTIQQKYAPSHLYTTSGSYTAQLIAKNRNGCTDTIKKQINIILPIPITKTNTPKEAPINTSPKTFPTQLEKRENHLMRNIVVKNDSISILLYDNGMIDGDSVTLIYNDEIIITDQLLTDQPLGFQLKIDPLRSKNELVVYAENLGRIPPNTALLIIVDGNEQHRIHVTSSKSRNGIISFTLRKR